MEERIVIDANIGISLVVQLPYSGVADRLIQSWSVRRVHLFAPFLWDYECVTGIRRAVALNLLSPSEALLALERFERLAIQKVPPRIDLHERALLWSGRLGQSKAYDAQYVALAEKLGVEFWTADERLWNAARRAGANWTRWIGEN